MDFRKIATIAAMLLLLAPQVGMASSGGAPLPKADWTFKGVFGRFDPAALKRGAQVANEVCLGCHAIKYIKYDHLRSIGLTEAEVKAFAEAQGKNKKDRMLSAMSDADAKESFGVVPPDLSLMTKARKGYENYTYGILTGYLTEAETEMIDNATSDDALSDEEIKQIAAKLHLDAHNPDYVREVVRRIGAGDNFNRYFPGNFFAMPQPLTADAVEYADGTKTTLEQHSNDVVTFLAWAAEPSLEARKSLGIKVILYLILLTVMLFAVKRRVWAKLH
ncbi:MAG: cytochrome c1 [Magnetococcales bacterium]|nr:cytochrome c1 [Magnetococcales bacterium]